MKKALSVGVVLLLIAGVSYTAYVVGWYHGLGYHFFVSGMVDAKSSLAIARSLRSARPELALELLEADLALNAMSLEASDDLVPEEQRHDYEIVLRQLREYLSGRRVEKPLAQPSAAH